VSFPRYPKYKDSAVKWMGEVPEHWSINRLGYYFTERREKVSDVEYPPLSVTKNGIVPQLETAAKTDDNDNRKRVCNGDFVINSRSDRKGSAGVSELEGSVSLINTVLRPIEELDSGYIHHLLRSQPFQEEFYRFGKGIVADLWSTNYSEMRNIVLAMPPFSEQRQIAQFLDARIEKLDSLANEQQQLIALLNEKRRAAITHAVARGLNPDAPLKPSGVKWLGDVPVHWEIRSLTSITAKITNGYVGPTRDILVDEGVRYLQSLHIKGNKIRFDTPYFVTEAWSLEHRKSILEGGDVLIVQTGDIGQVAVVTPEFAGCNCHALIVVSPMREQLDGEWLSWCLNSDYGFHTLLSIQTGALHPHLNCGNVKGVMIPVPPLQEQRLIASHIARQLEELDALIGEAAKSIDLLRERRAALISAAVTGKIDVRSLAGVDAEAA
jgi:type I restriction enzyme, S subunit